MTTNKYLLKPMTYQKDLNSSNPISFSEIYELIVKFNGNLRQTVEFLQNKYGINAANYHGLMNAIYNPRTRGLKTNTNNIYKYIGILTEEEFEHINKLIKDFELKNRHNKKKLYSLGGLCKCVECGRNYTILRNNLGVIYYRCSNRSKNINGKYICSNRKYIKYYELENLIYKELSKHYIFLLDELKNNCEDIDDDLSIILEMGLRNISFWLSLDNEMKWEINHFLIDEILLYENNLVNLKFKIN